MKKILFTILISLICLSGNAQTDIWNNNAFGIGYSYLNRDDFKDNNVDIWFSIYGVYLDASIGTSLKDYDEPSNMTSYGLNFGYLFPCYWSQYENTKILLGPVIGYTSIGYNNTHGYYDSWYGYYNYNYFDSRYSYFNYGVVGSVVLNHFQINGKLTRNQIGIGLGYAF